MTIGKRILEIRKKEKLTQAELGDRLNVTDKAVSKWENDTGEPSIQSLVDISKEFNVSLDYLMTGVKDVKNMSLSEKIAATDNLELYKENYRSAMELDLYFKEAITSKTLIDYLLEYRSEKVLKYIVEHVIGSYKDVFEEYHEEIVLFALENEWFDILNNEQKVRSGLYLYSLAIKDEKKPDENIRYSPSSFVLSGALADGIAKSEYMTEKSWNFILGYGGSMNWSKGIRVILEKAILLKHKQVNNIIKIIERCNSRIEDLKVKHRVGEAYSVYQFYSDGIYAERSYKFRVDYSYIPVSKQSVMNAIEIKDFSLAKKLNLLTNDKVPAYDLKMYEVNSNDKLSEKDKLRESVYVGELIDIDKLIQTKDFDLYEELIKEPATPYELAMKYLKTKEFKKLYKLAEDYHTPYSGYIKQYILDGKNGIEEYIRESDFEKHININKKYYFKPPHFKYKKHIEVNKNTILFEDIIKFHSDERFFIHALKTNTQAKDEALMSLVANRGKEVNLQRLLLNAGAKIHSKWIEEDGWGEMVERDEIDEVATQLLRNQLDIIENNKEDKTNE